MKTLKWLLTVDVVDLFAIFEYFTLLGLALLNTAMQRSTAVRVCVVGIKFTIYCRFVTIKNFSIWQTQGKYGGFFLA